MRQMDATTDPDQAEGFDIFTLAKKVAPTGQLQIAAMLMRGGINCAVQRIGQREEPCSPDVASLPFHYRADFSYGSHHLSLELSSNEAEKTPYPQTFLVQACLSRMLVRASADFADWRATMGQGSLAVDIAIYASACRKAQAMSVLFTDDQLQLLEKVTLEELGEDPSEAAYR